jgi:aspartyl-tRNA(Asn)/glutamyl-tRNA(Gln) amidotransferase subunit A
MKSLYFQSIASLSKKIASKEISSFELTNLLLERIQALEPSINAFIDVLAEDAKEQARMLEKELLEGTIRGPLHGVPIAIKDIFETKGSVTTSGSKLFKQWKSTKDAVVVQKSKEAGAIIIGKTNLHEFAMGATTENPHFGPTRNPWNLKKIPGGSSGGSAAAVAAGMCYGAIGTDTGGSIRLPAALCGIVGLKPTYDAVSRKGCTPLSWSLDHIGPMTRTVEDSAIMMNAITGDKRAFVQLPFAAENLSGVKIGVVTGYFMEDLHNEIKGIYKKALNKLSELGAEVTEVHIDHVKEALEAQQIISKSEAFTFHEPIFESNASDYGTDVRFRLNSAKNVTASAYLNAQRLRKSFRSAVLNLFKTYDVLLTPTNSREPLDIGTNQPEETIHTIFKLGKTPVGNFLGFPALTIPCGFTASQLPCGMQLIGKPYFEQSILSIGHIYEKSETWTEKLEFNQAYEKMANQEAVKH